MNPVALKLSISSLCLLVMTAGAFLLASFMEDGVDSVGMTLGAMLILVPASIMMTQLPRLWRYQVQTQAWYQATYPDSVAGNRIACYACGSNHIKTHLISRKTGHQGHVCGQCDTTLYYS